ncbi:MAG TPA: TolC family protein [Methylophilaceae bacterium]|nr:TolC family protein [Methylophilaceae bacterium]
MLNGCSFQTYHSQPINPSQTAAHYRAHDPAGPEFHQYLIAQHYPEDQLPIRQWGLRELTLCALFFHPQLDVARAQLQAAQAAEITAGQRPNPSASGDVGRSQDDAAPWVYHLGLDIPVETAGKRAASIAQAQSLSEAARIDIGQTAWQVRSRLLNSWIEYNAALRQQQVLQQELDLRSEIVAMLDKRLEAGMISSVEIGTARLQLQKTQQALAAEKGRVPELRAILASNAGLTVETLNKLKLETSDLSELHPPQYTPLMARDTDDALQDAALLNRLDIRAALARYDAAESRLRLEIARQYPDITLSPSHAFEEGYHIWSLGLSALLPLLNKNEGLIAEARALRKVEAAQFKALQAQVIGDIGQAKARYFAALDELELAHKAQVAQQAHLQQITQQFKDGYADRLELTTAKLENQLATQNMFTLEYNIERAVAALENAMQQPLEDALSVPNNMQQAVEHQPAP